MRAIAGTVLVLFSVVLGASPAGAALTKYRLKSVALFTSSNASPPVQKIGSEGGSPGEVEVAPFDHAFVDAGGAAPVLRKLLFKTTGSVTVEIPGLSGHIFFSNNYLEGTGPLRKPESFTGTGSTAAGSTITWGIVTGWTVTGAQWCKSSPPVICTIGAHTTDTTGEPIFNSDFYDLGTWIYHGTGFTSVPFVHQYITTNFGNNQRWIRGFPIVDATVPALPLFGFVLVGASVVLGALSLLRRARRS